MGSILDKAIADLNKTYGPGSVRSFKEDEKTIIDVISTGSFNLDLALGIGGLPLGRIIEIYGPESSGKTTLALHAVANAQEIYPDKKVVYIDMEHSMSPDYATNLGVNIQDWLFSQPNCGEEALEIAERLLVTNEISVVVVDSVAALIPQAELDGNFGDSKVGLQARLMSQAMRKLNASVSKTGTILIFINQLRDKIGVMWGSPETTTGGNALKFYASIRLDIRRIAQIKGKAEGDEAYGNKIKVKVVKNKLASPFKIAEFEIHFGMGIHKVLEIIDLCIDYEIFKIEGSKMYYKDIQLGQSREEVNNLLMDNEELIDDLKKAIQVRFGLIELTEDEKAQVFQDNKKRQWDLFEKRIADSVEKYKMNAGPYVENIEKNEFSIIETEEQLSDWIKKYKTSAYTIYGFSQEVKKYNIANEIK